MASCELDREEILTIQVLLSVLLFISLVLNILHILSIKPHNGGLNATDTMQISKTTIVILGLILHIPLEINTFGCREDDQGIMSLTKEIVEKLFLEMYPLVVLSVAITRLRASICSGNSNVLITKTSALISLAISATFPIGFTLGLAVMMLRENTQSTISSMNMYNLITLLMISIIPMIMLSVIYYSIFQRIKGNLEPLGFATISAQSGITQQMRHRKRTVVRQKQDTNMKLSIILLMVIFILSWTVFVILKVTSVIVTTKFVVFALPFSKVMVYLLHPIGEGVFLASKRDNLEFLIRKYCFMRKLKGRIEPSITGMDSTKVHNVVSFQQQEIQISQNRVSKTVSQIKDTEFNISCISDGQNEI